MRDRRDFVIAALAAALLFTAGLLIGGQGSVLPAADAQDSAGKTSTNPSDTGQGQAATGQGLTIGVERGGPVVSRCRRIRNAR